MQEIGYLSNSGNESATGVFATLPIIIYYGSLHGPGLPRWRHTFYKDHAFCTCVDCGIRLWQARRIYS